MISKMRALGLVLAAAFAVSAVAASAAMAEEETSPGHFFSHSANGKTHIRGEQEGTVNVLTITKKGTGTEGEPIGSVECPNEDVSFTGTPSDTEGNTVEENTSTDVRVHPVYSPETVKNCQVKLGETNFGKATVHTEGCDYVLSAHTDANEHASVHIECEPEKEITITAALGCVFHVPPQTPDAGVHYTKDETDGNTESEKEAVTVDATVREIQFTATESCPLAFQDAEFADYDSKITVKGFKDESGEEGPTTGPQTSITWTEAP